MKLIFVVILIIFSQYLVSCDRKDCFRAAVYQHYQLGNSNEKPSIIANKNLDIFDQIAVQASKEGVDILVFGEDAIVNNIYSRSVTASDLAEPIPDPSKGTFNPCENPEKFKELSTKTYRLSCLAKTNRLYVAANYGDRVDCLNSDPKCPFDRHFLFNTAVVFGPDGSLVAKYHKMQLFHELYYNVPPKPQFVYFDTPFGRMGLFICFDIIYRNPGIELITKHGVQTMIYSTWWFDEPPFRTGLQIQESWAVTNRVNLLSSNMHNPNTGSVGSGIYSGENGQMISSNIFEKSPHLLIADIPIDSRNTGAKCLTNRYNKTILNSKFWDENEYKPIYRMELKDSAVFQLLNDFDSINLCHNGLCCQLDYTLSSKNKFKEELFWFIVANQSANILHPALSQKNYRTSDQICGIFVCQDYKCQHFSTQNKETVFESLEIRAKMNTTYVYPTLNTNHLKLIPKNKWIYENQRKIGSEVKLTLQNFSEPILSFGLYGRCYDEDPPYQQK